MHGFFHPVSPVPSKAIDGNVLSRPYIKRIWWRGYNNPVPSCIGVSNGGFAIGNDSQTTKPLCGFFTRMKALAQMRFL